MSTRRAVVLALGILIVALVYLVVGLLFDYGFQFSRWQIDNGDVIEAGIFAVLLELVTVAYNRVVGVKRKT